MNRPVPLPSRELDALRALLDSLPDGALVLDEAGVVLHANEAAGQLLDTPVHTLVGRPFAIPVVDADRGEMELVRTDGRRTLVELRLSPLAWDGQHRVLASLRDVTRRRAGEDQLARRAAEVQALHRIATICLAATTEDEIYGPTMEEIRRATGWSAVLLQRLDEGAGTLTLVHGCTEQQVLTGKASPLGQTMGGEVLRTGVSVVVPDLSAYRHPSAGELLEIGVCTYIGVPVPGAHGPWGVLAIGHHRPAEPDTPLVELVETLASALAGFIDRVRASTALAASEERFRRLAEHAPDVLFRHGVGPGGGFEYVSPSCQVLTGYSPDELCESTWSLTRLVLPEERPAVAALLAGGPGPATLPLRWVRRDGSVVSVELRCVPVTDRQGAVVAVEGIARDVSEREAFEADLAGRALLDPLTGLANRALFHDHVAQVAARRDASRRSAVLFVDLDGFKGINDTVGHEAGDTLLREVALRLRRSVRPADTVARVGGDEFAVLCEDLDDEDGALGIATRIVSDARRPITLAERDVAVGASVGVAMVDRGVGVDDVLRRADLAMYRAKTAGRDQAVLFDGGMAAEMERLLLRRRDLRAALAGAELELRYQPQVDLRTGAVVGLEALLRWHHPTEGLLLPPTFLPAADHLELADALTTWVLDRALGDARRWVDAQHESSLVVAVNVSARQFGHPDFVGHVTRALQRHELEPRHLCLEVTEEILGHRSEGAVERLARLRDLGVLLALDDYGTGASSLRMLRDLPVHQLKIDSSFMAGLGVASADTALVRAIVDLGRDLWLPVVAEGVETTAQRQALLSFGCPQAQGLLFARPLDVGEVVAVLEAGHLDPRTVPDEGWADAELR